MSKVRRGGPKKKQVRRRTRAKSAAVSAPRRLRNWVVAQVRGARYRLANAARLGGVIAAGLIVLGGVGLTASGHMDTILRGAERQVHAQFARAGFQVEAVDITGADGATAEAVVAATQLRRGDPLLAVNPVIIRDRVEAMPVVRRATVARLWPNRISIIVETREAYALWQVDGALNIIDRYGVVLGEADAMNPPDLPLVVDAGANESAAEIITALSRYPDLSEQVVGAVRVGERRWNLRLDSGADVKLPAGDVQSAIAILSRIHAERGVLRLAAESFDMRGQGALIVRARPDRAAAAGMRERDA